MKSTKALLKALLLVLGVVIALLTMMTLHPEGWEVSHTPSRSVGMGDFIQALMGVKIDFH
jgi:uncharacterized protein YwbE